MNSLTAIGPKPKYSIKNIDRRFGLPVFFTNLLKRESRLKPNKYIVLTCTGNFMALNHWAGVKTVSKRTISELNYCLVAKNGLIKIIMKDN